MCSAYSSPACRSLNAVNVPLEDKSPEQIDRIFHLTNEIIRNLQWIKCRLSQNRIVDRWAIDSANVVPLRVHRVRISGALHDHRLNSIYRLLPAGQIWVFLIRGECSKEDWARLNQGSPFNFVQLPVPRQIADLLSEILRAKHHVVIRLFLQRSKRHFQSPSDKKN